MGNATSSALRADDPARPVPAPGNDGPAFGSLASLGAPKKFKKKPVLVLDPEELEKAHMMFQEASAELLGDEVQRPERGAAVLGLAPIDDEDLTLEDMGASDDSEAGDDNDDIPSAEDLLRMTGARPTMDEAEQAYIAEQLERLDIDQRIFPSLPMKSEEEIAAEEEAERALADAEPPMDMPTEHDEEEAIAGRSPLPDNSPEIAHEPVATTPEPPAHAFPVNPLPEPEAESEALPEAEFESALDAEIETQSEAENEAPPQPAPEPVSTESLFGDEPFLDFPTQSLRFEQPAEETVTRLEETEDEPEAAAEALPEHEPQPEPEPEPAPLPEAKADPAPEPEPQPAPEPVPEPQDEDAFEFELVLEDEWQVEEPPGLDPESRLEDDSEAELASSPDPDLEQAENDGSYTVIDDEPVDGYAFMYAGNPRGRTLQALASGESNSLRAKLIKERQDAQAEIEAAHQAPSIWARFASWLRGLLS